MKRNRSKLISAVAMLVISAIAVTSATYAWFTISNEVSATSLSLTAAAPANVQISLTGNPDVPGDWDDTVTFVSPTKKLRPVSTFTAFNDDFYDVLRTDFLKDVPDPIVEENGGILVPTSFKNINLINITERTDFTYYYDTTLYFRTRGTYPIDLTLNGLTVGADELNNAIRIAFLDNVTDEKYSNYLADAVKLIYANRPVTYKAAFAEDALSADLTPSVVQDNGLGNVIIRLPVDATLNGNGETDPNEYGAPQAVKVRIYLEGQDEYCLSDYFEDPLSVSLNFYGKEVYFN